MDIQQLIEDYKRKVDDINIMLETSEGEKECRLKTKKSCYNTFIVELERILYTNISISENIKNHLIEELKSSKTVIGNVSANFFCDNCGRNLSDLIWTNKGTFCCECVIY